MKSPSEVLKEYLEEIEQNRDKIIEDHRKALDEMEKRKNEALASLEELYSEYEFAIAALGSGLYNFTESENVPIANGLCTAVIGNLRYGKREENEQTQITIRKNGNLLNTTWEYLNDFFNSLPDTIAVQEIDGINRSKADALMNFYVGHVNFPCHLEMINNKSTLIKQEINLDTETAAMARAEPESDAY